MSLNRETLRNLQDSELRLVIGGGQLRDAWGGGPERRAFFDGTSPHPCTEDSTCHPDDALFFFAAPAPL